MTIPRYPDGLTPIQAAVYLGHSEVVRILAQYWISDSPNAPDHLGWIPIQTAAKKAWLAETLGMAKSGSTLSRQLS